MSSERVETIQRLLNEADTFLRAKLEEAGIRAAHVMLAVDEDGVGVVRSNVDAQALRDMAELLDEIAEETAKTEPDRPN